MFPENDNEFEDYILDKVIKSKEENAYELHFDKGGIGCENCPIEPVPGMPIRLYGKGFGYPVRGIFIAGQKVYYRTEAEQEAHHKAQVEDMQKKAKDLFESEGRAELDMKFDALPQVFKDRIIKFRNNNPDFRWKYEAYEMFCCEEAVKIARHFQNTESLNAWYKLPYEEKEAIFKVSDQHSGNTFGASCALAAMYLNNPDNVIKAHGALAPLVGSEEYGCVPKGEATL